MRVGGVPHRTIWLGDDPRRVEIIDQTRLPHEFRVNALGRLEDAERAIRTMEVRGAPLIGVTAAYGVYLALLDDPVASDPWQEAQFLPLRPELEADPTAIDRAIREEMDLALPGEVVVRFVPEPPAAPAKGVDVP